MQVLPVLNVSIQKTSPSKKPCVRRWPHEISSIPLDRLLVNNRELLGTGQGFWVQDCSAATENILQNSHNPRTNGSPKTCHITSSASKISMTVKVHNGCFYQFSVCHERLVGSFDQIPVPRQQSHSQTFLYSWPKGFAVGTHIVTDNLLVADTV